MPTYQYACTNPEARHQFEVVQSFTDAPVAECPTCGAPVRKVYGSVGVVFKGSGFYRTDSRSKASAGDSSSTTSPSESSSGSSSGSSSDSSKTTAKKESSTSSTPSSSGSKAAAG
ncbi:FmdB family zinc ribbon protein [Geodermatophilus sp. URMC 62]|uniref:FmdB family zinc ribbon protein n=1 Tax=Geodermatophilus sp. URMC 62 TaxID=3423414 RepID=UPI00406C07B2